MQSEAKVGLMFPCVAENDGRGECHASETQENPELNFFVYFPLLQSKTKKDYAWVMTARDYSTIKSRARSIHGN